MPEYDTNCGKTHSIYTTKLLHAMTFILECDRRYLTENAT